MDKNVKLHNTQGDVLFPATKSHIVEYDNKGSGLSAATVKDAIDLVASKLTEQSTKISAIEGNITELDRNIEAILTDTSEIRNDILDIEGRVTKNEGNIVTATNAILEVNSKASTNESNIISLAGTVQDAIDEIEKHGNNISTISTYLIEHDKLKIESGLADW